MPRRTFLLLLFLLLLGSGVATTGDSDPPYAAFEGANLAWEAGDYPAALKGYIALLKSPAAKQFLEPIALRTGELFVTEALATDARASRFSPDGKLIAFETGPAPAPVIRIVPADGSRATVVEVAGSGAAFSPAGRAMAYFRVIPSAELSKTPAIQRSDPGYAFATQRLSWLRMRDSVIVVRDLDSGQEREIKTPGLLKSALVWHPDGRTVLFLGGREADESRNDIYAVTEPFLDVKPITAEGGFKTGPVVDPSGRFLIYIVATQNVFRAPTPGPPGGRGGAPAAGQAGRGGAPGSGPPRPAAFGLVRLDSAQTRIIEGAAPTFSADGSALAFIGRSADEYIGARCKVQRCKVQGARCKVQRGPQTLVVESGFSRIRRRGVRL